MLAVSLLHDFCCAVCCGACIYSRWQRSTQLIPERQTQTYSHSWTPRCSKLCALPLCTPSLTFGRPSPQQKIYCINKILNSNTLFKKGNGNAWFYFIYIVFWERCEPLTQMRRWVRVVLILVHAWRLSYVLARVYMDACVLGLVDWHKEQKQIPCSQDSECLCQCRFLLECCILQLCFGNVKSLAFQPLKKYRDIFSRICECCVSLKFHWNLRYDSTYAKNSRLFI